jgi:hypothetical protein
MPPLTGLGNCWGDPFVATDRSPLTGLPDDAGLRAYRLPPCAVRLALGVHMAKECPKPLPPAVSIPLPHIPLPTRRTRSAEHSRPVWQRNPRQRNAQHRCTLPHPFLCRTFLCQPDGHGPRNSSGLYGRGIPGKGMPKTVASCRIHSSAPIPLPVGRMRSMVRSPRPLSFHPSSRPRRLPLAASPYPSAPWSSSKMSII